MPIAKQSTTPVQRLKRRYHTLNAQLKMTEADAYNTDVQLSRLEELLGRQQEMLERTWRVVNILAESLSKLAYRINRVEVETSTSTPQPPVPAGKPRTHAKVVTIHRD